MPQRAAGDAIASATETEKAAGDAIASDPATIVKSMRIPGFHLRRGGETFIALTATFAAIVLLACVLAYWTWTWFGPAPQPRSAPLAEKPRIESAYALFGGTPASAAAAPEASGLTLLGVASASPGRRGHSLLRVAGREPVVVREGEEVTPGVRVAEVHADRVVLDRNGTRETLTWPAASHNAPPARINK